MVARLCVSVGIHDLPSGNIRVISTAILSPKVIFFADWIKWQRSPQYDQNSNIFVCLLNQHWGHRGAMYLGRTMGEAQGWIKNPMEKACLQFAWWPTKLPLNRRGEALLLLSWRKMGGIIWKIFCMMAVAGRCPPASSSGPYSSPAVVHMRGGWDLRVSRLKDTGQLPLRPHCTVFVFFWGLY